MIREGGKWFVGGVHPDVLIFFIGSPLSNGPKVTKKSPQKATANSRPQFIIIWDHKMKDSVLNQGFFRGCESLGEVIAYSRFCQII